ncbi:thyrotroph embryonic factor-like isoform X2 [Mya arenaria]|uniref:thyrotroph embryonic factor-like isoform X2 n=1 Tax=Mya arenaria TaxID=6604 RepID=UPI0022E96E59|nr:thyrotroph embryonic factor-like isoform X2 [Mya arenaria]
MSTYRPAGQGFSLKALLENPDLQNPTNFQTGGSDLKKNGKLGGMAPHYNSAFLGSNMWDRQTGRGDSDLIDLEYMDLDEFLTENGIPVSLEEQDEAETINLLASALGRSPTRSSETGSPLGALLSSEPPKYQPMKLKNDSPGKPVDIGGYLPESPVRQQSFSPISLSPVQSPKSVEPTSAIERCLLDDNFGIKSAALQKMKPKVIPKVSIPTPIAPSQAKKQYPAEDLSVASIPGQENFDPTARKFSEEELKPQPIIKKSRKVFVTDSAKDDKYWQRRKKNNVAAKRSRDARRVKENQIAMRASFLERENDDLHEKYEEILRQNEELIKRLSKYEKV